MNSPITGIAAGVPFTALPPAKAPDAAPVLVTWHMLDAPRTDAAFAAQLPLLDVRAWRVHLGMPMCGARMVDGKPDAAVALLREEPLKRVLYPFVVQAVEEFPAALTSLRRQLPVDDGPIGLLGASLGGTVALQLLATTEVPVSAAALVNPAIRLRSAVALFGDYPYDAEAERMVTELDFLPHAGMLARRAPLLVVSGADDHADFRADALELSRALGDRGDLLTVPGLAHALADEPGLEPAPQSPRARDVDAALTDWFRLRVGTDPV